jgi:hypothetical protein
MNADMGHIAEHLHDENSSHDQDSTDHGCHVHASHSFAESDVEHLEKAPLAPTVHHYILAELNLKKLPFLIEHPPKLQHS